MLKKFKVKNFKHFKDEFVFDLSEVKDYKFNPECVNDGIVAKSVIYGPNGCGKSNLGYALFDLKMHLDDDTTKLPVSKYSNYLNADSSEDLAEFEYTFQFGEHKVVYSYGKKSVKNIVYERFMIDGKKCIALDRRRSNEAFVDLAGAETLNRDLSGSEISVIKYVKNNVVLLHADINSVFKLVFSFLDNMTYAKVSDVEVFSTDETEETLAALFDHHSDLLPRFEEYLNVMGVKCTIDLIERDEKKKLVFVHKNRNISFLQEASVGTIALLRIFVDLHILGQSCKISKLSEALELDSVTPFIFIDEFDAFYHQKVAKAVVTMLKDIPCQAILTTHNTGIMSNELLRPDCYFVMSSEGIKPIYKFTDKELRVAHNIEKMYRAGTFSDE